MMLLYKIELETILLLNYSVMEDVKGKEIIGDAPTENKVSDEVENHKQPSSENEVVLFELFLLLLVSAL